MIVSKAMLDGINADRARRGLSTLSEDDANALVRQALADGSIELDLNRRPKVVEFLILKARQEPT